MTTITDEQIAKLLALVAAFDRRGADTITADDIEVWSLMAAVGRWSFAAARRAIVEHYAAGAGAPRLVPAEITDRLRVVRRRALELYDADRPATAPAVSAAHELTAFRAGREAFANELVGLWAATGADPEAEQRRRELANPARAALPAGRPADLAALVEAAPPGVQVELRQAQRRIAGRRVSDRAPALTPAARAAARDELNRARPLAQPDPAGVPSPTHRTDHAGSPE